MVVGLVEISKSFNFSRNRRAPASKDCLATRMNRIKEEKVNLNKKGNKWKGEKEIAWNEKTKGRK